MNRVLEKSEPDKSEILTIYCRHFVANIDLRLKVWDLEKIVYVTVLNTRHAELFEIQFVLGRLNSLLKDQGGLVDMVFPC